MPNSGVIRRLNTNSRTGLRHGDSKKSADTCSSTNAAEVTKSRISLCKDVDGLKITKNLVRVVSEKFKKKMNDLVAHNGQETVDSRLTSSGCLSLYMNGGCRVGACDELDVTTSANDDCMPKRNTGVGGKDGVECSTYGASERFSKKNIRKGKSVEKQPTSSNSQGSLPDDVLEMILARLPFPSLITARCVCKKWKCLTTTSHFMEMRCKTAARAPWLFLFGITRDGSHLGEIHALDVSLDQWHRVRNHNLRRRFLFSVASIGSDIYIVGGCSNSSFLMEKGSVKTHRGVLVFSPLTGLWRKETRLRSARSRSVLGVFEIKANCTIFHTQSNKLDRPTHKARSGGTLEVFGDPHRLSVRRRLRDAFFEDDDSPEPMDRHHNVAREETGQSQRFALIAVGGYGCWDEPLESGEVYDPTTGKWVDIPNLPGDFGAVCSGVVCQGIFYVFSESDKLAGYNLERGFWVTIQISRPPPRIHEYSPKLVSCRDRLFLLSVSWCERPGQLNRRDKAVRKLLEFDWELTEWNEVARHPDAPMDRNSSFIADNNNNTIYGVEMFGIFGQVLDFVTACHVSDTDFKWSHVSKKHAAHEADPASCTTMSMVVLHL